MTLAKAPESITRHRRQGDINYYSISRLDTYHKCGQHYKLKYIEKVPSKKYSRYTLIGSILHQAIEDYYTTENWQGTQLDRHFAGALEKVLVKQHIIGEFESDRERLISGLVDYSSLTLQLYERAKESYKGPDPIRTKDGKVPSNPQRTSTWTRLEAKWGISMRKEATDKYFSGRTPDIDFSLCDVVSEARLLCEAYRHNPEITEVHGIEVSISEVVSQEGEDLMVINPVSLEPLGVEGFLLHGYVDMVASFNGEPIIIDHKTSTKIPSVEEIQRHIQLLSYTWALDQINPSMPIKYIGIDHIRSGQLIMTEVPPYRNKLLKDYFAVHQSIQDGHFYKRTSECENWFGQKCPYFDFCHTHT